jgi:hypothetical protein
MDKPDEDEIIQQVAKESKIPVDLLVKILDLERSRMYQRKRKGIMTDLRKIILEACQQ